MGRFFYGVEEVDWDEKAFGAKDAKRSALSQKHSHPSGSLKREKKIEEKLLRGERLNGEK